MSRRALLLVDLQRDFLDEPALTPPAPVLVERVGALVARCRDAGVRVVHVRTVAGRDGSGRMPHWVRGGDDRCIEGTPGAGPPDAIEATPGEPVYHKTFYSAFDAAGLDDALRAREIDTLLVAGVHTHACIQATVLDAYRLGYAVRLVSDATASYSPLHADLATRHLRGRACEAVTVAQLFPGWTGGGQGAGRDCETHPVAFIGGQWQPAAAHEVRTLRDPCAWDRTVGRVPLAGATEVARAAAASAAAQPDWAQRTSGERAEVLYAWATALERRQGELVELLVREVAKPRAAGEAELGYALDLLRGTLDRSAHEPQEESAGGARVRYCPLGAVAVVTPWNNPLALPVGKLAPALIYGNTVVWKPALQAPLLARALVESLVEAGLPPGCVNAVFGDAGTVQRLVQCPEVAAVSFTGSEDAGREIGVACSLRGIPLQAELGGNNAALVAADADVDAAARDLAAAAFSFSGQRCTAPRRLIVVEPVYDAFRAAFGEAVGALKVGDPRERDTHVGPLISRSCQAAMEQWVHTAVCEGAHVVTGGRIPDGLGYGCWFEPTVLAGARSESAIVQEETFGPLVVLLKARDLDDGIRLCNGVRHGLRAVLYATSPQAQARFLERVRAGVVHLNGAAAAIEAAAPFLGWGGSGVGPPEHGRWDRDFFTRTQAVYGGAGPAV